MSAHAGPILVATDFSRCGERATELALRAGHALQLPVVLVHVMDVGPQARGEAAAEVEVAERILHARVDARVAGARRALEREALRAHGAAASTEVLDGRPSEAIVAHARAIDASLIVVGAHGASGARETALGWVLGSTADRVVHASPCPVLVVPTECGPTSLEGGRWIAGVELDEASLHALATALELAARCGARVDAVDVSHGKSELEPHDVHIEDERDLAALAREARERAGVSVTPSASIVHGDPASTLIAASEGAALLIVGTHARSAVARAIHGSVAAAVLRAATTPLLVVPLLRESDQRASGRAMATT